jgi:SAM-dependent methyltransferase
MGHAVTGIDFSPAMIQKARAKAAKAGYPIQFLVMDAVAPALAGQTLDALVCRHVLWALPEPDRVLQRWANLVRPGGRMILIEGFWHTGAGLSAGDALALLPPHVSVVATVSLSEQSVYWGKAVGDERYALIVEVGQVYISKDEDHIHNDRYQR